MIFYLKGPCLSTWPKTKVLCLTHRERLWPCPPVRDSKKEARTQPSPGWPPGAIWRGEALWLCSLTSPSLHFTPRCLPLSVLPLTVAPYCLSLWLCNRTSIQTLTRCLLWGISLLSSRSAGFPNKVIFFASTPHLSDSLACHCGKQTVLGFGNPGSCSVLGITFSLWGFALRWIALTKLLK